MGTGADRDSAVDVFELDGAGFAGLDAELADLRARDELYRALFEVNAAIKLLIEPSSGQIVDANPAAEAFYGWTLAELRAMNISAINVLRDQELHAELERATAPRASVFHFRHRVATGELRDVDVYSGPVTLRGRALLLSIVHDVSARVALEEQLRRAQRLDAIGQLAAGVAHDFNNLLTIALASVERATRKLPADHPVVADLADVKRTAQQGAALTRQMLAFARQQSLAPMPTDLAGLIRRVVTLLQRVLGDHIVVRAETGPETDPPIIRIDPGQLELAFINLALNARDAMGSGGTLTIRIAPDVAETAKGRVHVVVEDTGSGMDADTRAHAFEPFFTTKPHGIGTGLGLAAVYGLVSQSDGQVWIDSAVGEGTRVHLLLPIDGRSGVAMKSMAESSEPPPAPPMLAAAAEAEGAAESAGPRTVLVVDDRADVRGALANALEVVGLIVQTAGSAAEALARVELLGGQLDVVLSDVSMPGRSGLQLADDLRERWPDLPVVLMSGNAQRYASFTQVAAWIEKPFALDDVIAVLERVTRKRA